MFQPRSAAAPTSPPSVEVVRQRAKHRLIGVSVLVLAAVLLFPVLFDSQPRPIAVDIPIDIPSRKTVKPLSVEATPVAGAPEAEPATPVQVAEPVKPAPVVPTKVAEEEVVLSHTPARPKVESAPVAGAAKSDAPVAKETVKDLPKEPAKAAVVKEPPKEPVKEPVKEAAKPTPAKEAAKDTAADAARAQAILEGRSPAQPAPTAATADPAGARFIVQVGAFADPAAAQATRLKLERAGLKTYTHEAQTPEGKRIRVRLGPFATRAEAEKAATKAKAVGTAAAILTL